MIRYKIILPLSFLAMFLVVSACRNNPSNESATTEEMLPEDIVEMSADQAKLAGIDTGHISIREIPERISANGIVTVAPGNMVSICAPGAGYISNCNHLPGDQVSKGEVLARIENQEFIDIQRDYLEAKNRLIFAESEYQRHSELYKEDVYSAKNVQQVTTDYKNLKAQVKALEQKLLLLGIDPKDLSEETISRAISLMAPISGYLKTMTASNGKYVNPSDVLFELVNTSKLLLDIVLYEKDLSRVNKGQKVSFMINNEQDRHEAVVVQTGKAVNADKTSRIFAEVEGHCPNVLPGMYVNCEIQVSGNRLPSVPSEAIVNFNDKDYIFIFERKKEENGKPFTEYRMVEIQKGKSGNGYTEVILPPGFPSSAILITKGAYNLLSAKKNAGEMSC